MKAGRSSMLSPRMVDAPADLLDDIGPQAIRTLPPQVVEASNCVAGTFWRGRTYSKMMSAVDVAKAANEGSIKASMMQGKVMVGPMKSAGDIKAEQLVPTTSTGLQTEHSGTDEPSAIAVMRPATAAGRPVHAGAEPLTRLCISLVVNFAPPLRAGEHLNPDRLQMKVVAALASTTHEALPQNIKVWGAQSSEGASHFTFCRTTS